MIIDIHIHEKTYSSDSHISLIEIVARAKEIGLDGICITDHESNGLKEYAAKIAKEKDFLIIVGAEILTYEGDILVFGLPRLPSEKLNAHQLVHLTNNDNGITIAAHPFRQNNRGMGSYFKDLAGIGGVEAFNGSTEPHENCQAYDIALASGLPSMGGSDAHVIEQVGKYATFFPDTIKNELDFINAIKSNSVYPVYLSHDGYKKCLP